MSARRRRRSSSPCTTKVAWQRERRAIERTGPFAGVRSDVDARSWRGRTRKVSSDETRTSSNRIPASDFRFPVERD